MCMFICMCVCPHSFLFVELARMGGRLLLDDDIRLISRSGHRSFGGEDFTDIFADGMSLDI